MVANVVTKFGLTPMKYKWREIWSMLLDTNKKSVMRCPIAPSNVTFNELERLTLKTYLALLDCVIRAMAVLLGKTISFKM